MSQLTSGERLKAPCFKRQKLSVTNIVSMYNSFESKTILKAHTCTI